MYAIGNIIYGTPLTEGVYVLAKEVQDAGESHPLFDKLCDEEQFDGFETWYHGSSPWPPGFCGVKLGQFDERNDFAGIDIFSLQPTPEQRVAAEAAYNSLPEAVQECCLPLDTYIVWSTS